MTELIIMDIVKLKDIIKYKHVVALSRTDKHMIMHYGKNAFRRQKTVDKLIALCQRNHIPYRLYDFSDIAATYSRINQTVEHDVYNLGEVVIDEYRSITHIIKDNRRISSMIGTIQDAKNLIERIDTL